MKRKNKNLSLIMLCGLFGLTSCSFSAGTGSSSEIQGSTTSNSSVNTSNDNENVPQSKIDRAYAKGLDIRHQYNVNYLPSLPSVGNSKMLVVPVKIKGEALPADKDVIKSSLAKAFFGKSEDTGWESVSSFYEKSSYGKQHISGSVSNILETNYTLSDLRKANDEEASNITNKILQEAYDMYFIDERHSTDEFDSDKDGFIDSIYLVYLTEEDPNHSALWAYTYWWNSMNPQDEIKYQKLGAYCWSSYNFMLHDDRFSWNKPDAHTYIHESGHLQSLDDYYNYYDGSTSPMGGIAMMDFNIGDHDSFTKYSLGWTIPEVITDKDNIESKTIKLRPFESTGDSLVIANNFNHTSLDEYLIMEYYTPTGLNKADSERTYELGGEKCFTVPGIKIYHVDQRLGVLNYANGWQWDGKFVDDIITTNDSYTHILASNGMNYRSKEGYSESGFNLVTLMDGNRNKNDRNPTIFERMNVPASNSTLFKSGDTFENHYENFRFNDNSNLKYNIKIGSMTTDGCEITVTRK